jgi:uncharacterized protein YdbL (DUF1318 family)
MRRLTIALALASAAIASPAAAQNASLINAARQAGQIGERYDGYMGVVGAAPDNVRRQVGAVNLRRRNIYISVGARRSVAAHLVGIATGCELLKRVQVGDFYMLGDNAWRRRMPGEAVPLPNYCGG